MAQTPPDDWRTGRRSSRTYGSGRRTLGLAHWRPNAAGRPLAEAIDAVLAEYQAYWPLTVRQVGYRLVGVYGYAKSPELFAQVGDRLNRGRRSGRYPWHAIRDDGAVGAVVASGYSGADDFWQSVRADAEYLSLDRHAGQPTRVLVWCEATGMAPALQAAVQGLPCHVASGGGMNSVTVLWDEALAMARDKRPAQVLYVGDLDRDGCVIEDRVADELYAFTWQLTGSGLPPEREGGLDFRFATIAVTEAQVAEYGLPSKPGGEGYQAEALPPDALASITRDAVLQHTDQAALAQAAAAEAQVRAEVLAVLDTLDNGGTA